MLSEVQMTENTPFWDLQDEENRMASKKPATPEEKFYAAHPEMVEENDPGMRARDALGKRHRVLLFSPDKLAILAGKGRIGAYDAQLELKKDVADALKQFSPVERRIIFRVFVQGQSIDAAVKGSRYSAAHWTRKLRNELLPKLRESLKDYSENGKVVLG